MFLFLHGGPSQFETFDPKMTAPAEIRSATGEIKTALPGVTFGSTFPKLAKLADRLAIVRSFVPGDANHDIKTDRRQGLARANIGSRLRQRRGRQPPVERHADQLRAVPAGGRSRTPGRSKAASASSPRHGPFPASAAPFQPDGNGSLKKDMKLNLPLDRLDDRRALLDAFDAAEVAATTTSFESMDAARQKAFSHPARQRRRGVRPRRRKTRRRSRSTTPRSSYDVTKIDKKWNNYKHYADNAKTLGKLLLLARRLVERGAGFVTVTTNFVWDMHADVNNATMTEGMGYMAPPLDHAVSVFLDDLRDRGLEDKVLLVACGEMGRTPRINKKGGRDHWGNLGPLLLAGGGLPRAR